jgi:hypothetical protein
MQARHHLLPQQRYRQGRVVGESWAARFMKAAMPQHGRRAFDGPLAEYVTPATVVRPERFLLTARVRARTRRARTAQ